MAATKSARETPLEVPLQFWLVVRDPRTVRETSPKQIHYTEEAARSAAERLALDTGHRYYVMHTDSYVQTSTPPVVWGSIGEP